MAADLIVSVSGIRGIVGESLTPDVALAFAQAYGSHLGGGRVLLSRDGRPSGAMLGEAVSAGLRATGCAVEDLEVQPTPTVGVAVRASQAAGAVQITASHNPAPYNGLKLFGPDGAVLAPEVGQAVVHRFRDRQFTRASCHGVGARRTVPPVEPVFQHILRIGPLVDVQAIARKRLRVLVDANGGAGSTLATWLLQSLGVATVLLGEATGVFAHEPEPTEENLRTLGPRVPENQCDLGFALDPDADRLAIIDETGRYIGEELTLALALEAVLRHRPGPVVVNMSTSRVNEDLAQRHRCAFHRSAVGEANVVAMMRQVGAVLGGEGNGGVIEPRVGWVRDPFVGMAYVLGLMADTGRKLSELVAALPRYAIVKEKFTIDPSRLPAIYDRLVQTWPAAVANRMDGLRLDWPDRWVHLRPSNTEPIVRIIAEAPEADTAQRLCHEVGKLLS